VEVQRCQIHKRRNVKEYLPENCQKDYDRRMRNAYAMSSYTEAKAALQKIFRQLERINPSAARSLEEGLEETLTVHRLGIGAVLRGNWPPPTRSNRACRRCSGWRAT
jgi:Transposase, Mutator family.